VSSDGYRRDVEAIGYLSRGETAAKQVEDFRLPPGELDRRPARQPQPAPIVARPELLDHRPEKRSRKRRLATQGCVQSSSERLGLEILLQIAGRAGPKRLQKLVFVHSVREDDDLSLRYTRGDPPDRSHPPSREPCVDKAKRRPLAQGSLQRHVRFRRFGADLETVALQQQPDPLACGQLRLCDQDAWVLARHRSPRGVGFAGESTTLCPCAF
jgi:hypothetical protein